MVGRLVGQLVNGSVSRSVEGWSVSLGPVGRILVGQLVGRSVAQLVNGSVGRSVDRSVGRRVSRGLVS